MAPKNASLNSVAFQRAFVAVSYFVGQRSSAALAPFEVCQGSTRALLNELAHSDQARRAGALGRELERVALTLEERAVR